LIVDGLVNAAIVKLWSSGIPLADAFLEWRKGDMSGEQMKSIANIFEQLLAKVLSAENTAISQEDADVSTQHLDMKTDLTLCIVSPTPFLSTG
jgi:hypothetical protein